MSTRHVLSIYSIFLKLIINMKSLYLFLFFSMPLLAQETFECRELSLAEKIVNFIPSKECPGFDEIILNNVAVEYKKNFGHLPLVRQKVKGFYLVGTASELSTAKEMLGNKTTKGWKEAAINCETIQCAMAKLLKSKEAAMQVMNIKIKSGYILSLDQTINQGKADQLWSAQEIREIDAAFSKMPRELRNLTLSKIERLADGFRRGDDSAQVAAFASPYVKGYKAAELVSYDAGMQRLSNGKNPYKTTSWPQEVMIHELCHHQDYKGYYASNYGAMTSEKLGSTFGKLSGWKEKTDAKGKSVWTAKKDSKFVSWYAETSPAEDYAETCMNYVLHPETLKKKAPEKYAYMKKYLFNNNEFSNSPWNDEKSKNWPQLANLVSDESTCNAKLAKCAEDLKFSDFFSPKSQLQNSDCLKTLKEERLQEISASLSDHPMYCELGGQSTISSQLNNICKASTDHFLKLIDGVEKTDLKVASQLCETKNDFTHACVIENAKLNLTPPKELVGTLDRIIQSKIPDRMAALGNKINEMSTSAWLTACLKTAKGIDVYEVTDGASGIKRPIYSYKSSDPNIQDSFLGNYIYKDYNKDDMNKSCADAAIKALSDEGIKTPESGFPVNVMQKPFLDELKTFEKEVLKEIGPSMKGCLFNGCKNERILGLMKAWEEKSPQKRKGFASMDQAREIREKVSTF
jgi:hypothetical protein